MGGRHFFCAGFCPDAAAGGLASDGLPPIWSFIIARKFLMKRETEESTDLEANRSIRASSHPAG